MVNPLIDEIFCLLIRQPIWKVHTLASALSETNHIKALDDDPQKDLFKRNFLVMNALYQLQLQLVPDYHLRIASLHIELVNTPSHTALLQAEPLRDYYLDWHNYDTSNDEIAALLDNFWQHFGQQTSVNTTKKLTPLQHQEIRERWNLNTEYSLKDVQKRWRQLALKHHPDKQGSAVMFKQIQGEYEQLKLYCSL
ncbi:MULTISPECIES: DNA-J related domain-containing protein [unclassified Pseudoalteromonas]|uniref:DNA-J related domain-containing protein n=1 Tax=unclassified Pseudoalteromonas TaxID=194690 RepID=UPI001EF14CED|nr:DNA-J related domain-containing protein [Pseudoalteromonas sp. L21]MCF7520319.1 DnaJ domain-containing protein [Pseudoalteromonas sp. L21]UJX27133.1 DnaJ domain-containing protein [Pseudoalteromonas sp. CF6-2]